MQFTDAFRMLTTTLKMSGGSFHVGNISISPLILLVGATPSIPWTLSMTILQSLTVLERKCALEQYVFVKLSLAL
jgi:hypothetical protein